MAETAGPSTALASLRSGRDDNISSKFRDKAPASYDESQRQRTRTTNDQGPTAKDQRPTTAVRILPMKNRPVIFVLLSALLLLPGCTMWREHPGSNKWTDATGGEGLERSFWKEVKDKKWNELERHMASNYVAVSPEQGRLDKAGALAQLQQIQLDDYSLGDLQAELNSDTFVVTYTVAMRGTLAGQPLASEPVHMMTVWQKQKAGWMAIAHSVLGAEKK